MELKYKHLKLRYKHLKERYNVKYNHLKEPEIKI